MFQLIFLPFCILLGELLETGVTLGNSFRIRRCCIVLLAIDYVDAFLHLVQV